MQQVSVFDIAHELLGKAPSDRLPTLKLQKLCFYVYGWYAHLTGDPLFPETFYAMEKGPVVGELLSAHAGKIHLTKSQLLDQFEVRETEPQELEPYVKRIIEAIWHKHEKDDRFALVDATHLEDVWKDAWESRAAGSKRGKLSAQSIIDHFVAKPCPVGLQKDLPLSVASKITAEDFEKFSSPIVHDIPVVAGVRQLRFST